MSGFNFGGGHDETKGLDASDNIVAVPLHRHEVSLDYYRIEPGVTYSFAENWDILLRIPYEIKELSARKNLIDPATVSEQAEMERNLNIHHRDRTYRGFADLMLVGGRHWSDVLREGDQLKTGFGLTLPTGRTEENPFKLGDQGLEHLHIQFGTGTFDPLLELNYFVPLSDELSLTSYAMSRFPFYKNSKTYRGPIGVTTGAQARYRASERITVHVGLIFHYQSFAHWDGERDQNSGLLALSGTLGAGTRINEKTNIGIDIRYPILQETLDDEGDAFEQGPTVVLSLSRLF